MMYNVFDSNRIPTTGGENVFAKFLVEQGLYDSIEITRENIGDLIDLLDGNVKISAYCKDCNTERVFRMAPVLLYEYYEDELHRLKMADRVNSLQKGLFSAENIGESSSLWGWMNWEIKDQGRVMVFQFECAMNSNHRLDYVVLSDNHSMKKIGQFPTYADLTFPELEGYKKVLSTENRRELRRAIGLYASGIGAGAYVYLRRTLEHLLMKAKENAGAAVDDDDFAKARVSEKITMLAEYLPKALTNNPVLYGILSKGIHELSEKECIAYFPVVKDCIFLILSEWEEMRKKAEKEDALRAALSKIATEIS